MSNTDKKGIIQPTSHNPLELTYRYSLIVREFFKSTVEEGLAYLNTRTRPKISRDQLIIKRVHLFINYANYIDYE